MPRTTTTSINLIALSLGGAAGFLSAALVALILWGLFTAVAVSEPVTAAIVGGVVVGLFLGGYVAGRISYRSVFHGSLTSLLAGAAITLLALGEGSPAPPLTMAGFIIGSAIIGGLGGFLADRRRSAR